MEKKVIHTDKAASGKVPLSQAIAVGEWLYCSGQLPIDPATGELVPGGAGPQTRRIIENLKAVCEEAGTSLSNAVKVTIFYLYRDGYVRTMTPKAGEYSRRASTEVTEIECDSVILCTARISNDGLFRELKARNAEWAKEAIKAVYQIGDCHAPRLIANCVFDGHRLAREFESEDPQYPLPWIRERQVWGHETFPKL